MMYTQKQIDRFWSNVAICGPDECWPWKRSVNQGGGYGQVALHADGVDRVHKAHKVAYEIHNNARLPVWQRVRHSCTNKLCCNPRHIVCAMLTHSPLSDTAPHAQGEKHGRAKLTEKQARLIKYKLNLLSIRDIAEAFGVAYHTVWDIRRNVTWRHI